MLAPLNILTPYNGLCLALRCSQTSFAIQQRYGTAWWIGNSRDGDAKNIREGKSHSGV
jgi:hypothetical protein